jgi:hypothetical protein
MAETAVGIAHMIRVAHTGNGTRHGAGARRGKDVMVVLLQNLFVLQFSNYKLHLFDLCFFDF